MKVRFLSWVPNKGKIILLRLEGEEFPSPEYNDITEELWQIGSDETTKHLTEGQFTNYKGLHEIIDVVCNHFNIDKKSLWKIINGCNTFTNIKLDKKILSDFLNKNCRELMFQYFGIDGLVVGQTSSRFIHNGHYIDIYFKPPWYYY